MIILAIDTALETCSVAVVDGSRMHRPLAVRSELMARGHQERLAPMAADAMAEAGLAFDALDRIAVTVGPGSFTGLRVGLAFAKGLGLALDKPVVGIGTLDALAFRHPDGAVAVIDARRGQVYFQRFLDGRPKSEARALSAEAAAEEITAASHGGLPVLIGPGAELLASMLPGAITVPRAAPDPVAVARLGLEAEPVAPRPIYLRAPDAKLPASALSA